MPQYSYIAQSFEGKRKSGLLEAKDEHHLAKILHQQGYVLVSAGLEEGEKKKRFSLAVLGEIGTVSLKEKLMFVRNLQVMIEAGITLPRALETLAGQSKNKKFQKALLGVKEELIKGKSFSESLSKYPSVFSNFFSSMIKVGEETGTLGEVLKSLSQKMEKEHELKAKVKGALIYPTVVVTAMIGIGVLMLIMVVPQLESTFKDMGVELPFSTRLVMATGNFLAEEWYWGILIILALLVALRFVLKIKTGKKILDAILLKIPIINNIIKKTNSAVAIRSLSSLISSGMPIVRSLEILAGTINNFYFRQVIIEAVDKVKKGEKLSSVLEPYQDLYSPLVIQMVAVGEETGETSFVLSKLADFFEDEVSRLTKNLASIIEPILMIIIGGAIGFFAISMLQPMYGALGNL